MSITNRGCSDPSENSSELRVVCSPKKMSTESTPGVKTRSAAKQSPDSVTSSHLVELTKQVVHDLCGRKKDPLVKLFVPEGTTQHQRNFVVRGFIYTSRLSDATDADFADILNYIQGLGDNYPDNYSAEDPFELRFAGARSLWRFVGFIQHFKHLFWAADNNDPKLFLAVHPRDEFYPIT